MSTEDQELPAVYRSLSREALERLLDSYRSRRAAVRGPVLRELYATRIRFLEDEIARREP